MRTLILAVVATFAAASAAQARSIEYPVQGAKLTQLDVDPQLTRFRMDRGSVRVDYAKGEVTLVLAEADPCGGRRCMPIRAAERLEFRLPIVKVGKDSCGSRVILASKDERPVDGALEQIKVTDNRGRVCDDLRSGTEVELRTQVMYMNGGGSKTRSTFRGEALRPLTSGSAPADRR